MDQISSLRIWEEAYERDPEETRTLINVYDKLPLELREPNLLPSEVYRRAHVAHLWNHNVYVGRATATHILKSMLRELVDKQRKVAVSMGFPEDGSNEELFLFMKEMREFLAEVF